MLANSVQPASLPLPYADHPGAACAMPGAVWAAVLHSLLLICVLEESTAVLGNTFTCTWLSPHITRKWVGP